MPNPRPLPPTVALYELQLDDALRSLARSPRGPVPTPPFQTVLEAFHAGKPAHLLAQELMDSFQNPPESGKKDDGGQGSLF